jgi:hypothetical protein
MCVMPGSKVLYKRAEDIEIGDRMWAQAEEKDTSAAVYVVKRIDTVVKQGVYNPSTLGGTIIVNGVVASSHSDWFLDSVFEAMGVTHWLPAAYQLILLPARVLYAVVGKDAYIRMYEHVDSLIDIAHFGTHHGAQFAVTVATLCAALVALSPLHMKASPKSA